MASLLMRSVSTVPGHTALTAMPWRAQLERPWSGSAGSRRPWRRSRRRGRERRACRPGSTRCRSARRRRPPPSGWRTAFDTSQVPTTLTSSTRRNSSAATLSSGPSPKPGPLPPATLATSVTVPSSSLTAATAASTARLVGHVGHRGRRRAPQRGDLLGQRGQVVAAGGAVGRRLGVGPGDVEAGHVRPARGQRQRGGPPDAPRPGRPGDQRHPARERARLEFVCETHRANVATMRAAAPPAVRGVVPCGPR